MAEGVRRLAEGWVIEVAETVAEGLWGRMLDGAARNRVKSQMQPRVEDAVRWVESLSKL